MALRYHPYDRAWVRNLRAGGPDDYGLPAERAVSDGAGNPCRYCLDFIPRGAGMLICAARPFPDLQPYAETGPVFFCTRSCGAWAGAGLPPILRHGPDFLLKGYGADHRIIYGTGQIVTPARLERACETLFESATVAHVDVRSARNNCFQTRITRG